MLTYIKQLYSKGLFSIIWIRTYEFVNTDKKSFLFFNTNALYQKYVMNNRGFTKGCLWILFFNLIFCTCFYVEQFTEVAPLLENVRFLYCIFYLLIIYLKFWLARVVFVFFYIFIKHGGFGLTKKQAYENSKNHSVIMIITSSIFFFSCFYVLYCLPDGRDTMNVFILDDRTWFEFAKQCKESLICFFAKIVCKFYNPIVCDKQSKQSNNTSGSGAPDFDKNPEEKTYKDTYADPDNRDKAREFVTDVAQNPGETYDDYVKRAWIENLRRRIADLDEDEIKAWENFWGRNDPDFREEWLRFDRQYDRDYDPESGEPRMVIDFQGTWNPTYSKYATFVANIFSAMDGGSAEHKKGRFKKLFNEMRLDEGAGLCKYRSWCNILDRMRHEKKNK